MRRVSIQMALRLSCVCVTCSYLWYAPRPPVLQVHTAADTPWPRPAVAGLAGTACAKLALLQPQADQVQKY